jgi:hypothetical protein
VHGDQLTCVSKRGVSCCCRHPFELERGRKLCGSFAQHHAICLLPTLCRLFLQLPLDSLLLAAKHWNHGAMHQCVGAPVPMTIRRTEGSGRCGPSECAGRREVVRLGVKGFAPFLSSATAHSPFLHLRARVLPSPLYLP